jgi:hypothetical protein
VRSMFAKVALIGALVLAAMPFIDSATASAGAVTQTQPFTIDECTTDPTVGYPVVCAKGKGVTHTTIRPNGDVQNVVHQNICYRIGAPRFLSEGCEKSHETYITKKGEPQVHRTMSKEQHTSTLFLSGGSGTRIDTCTSRVHLLYANGQPRIDKVESHCESSFRP